jgi:hypothetical protein
MDLPAIPSVAPGSQAVAGVRAAASAQPVAVDNTLRDAPQSFANPNPLSQAVNATAAARRANKDVQNEEKQAAQSTPERASVGRIRFEMEDGTRIAKFFDTKDVLIYQVPPEGRLFLVKTEEASGQDQVATSA